MLEKLKSPELWVACLVVAGPVGLLCPVVGSRMSMRWLYLTGLTMCVAGGITWILLLFVLVPMAILANRRHRRH